MVLVVIETSGGKLKKAGQEALTYGKKLAGLTRSSCTALFLGEVADPSTAGLFGADRVVVVNQPELTGFDPQVYTSAIVQTARKLSASFVVLSATANGKALTGQVAVKLEAGCVSGVNEMPIIQGENAIFPKSVFSGKATAQCIINTPVKVVSVAGNALKPDGSGAPAPVETQTLTLPAPRIKVIRQEKVEGVVPLPEAEIVVSAGRGMKGPENWGIVEDLAHELGATTACSRPVADSGWRPHHEHVGQTGIAIRPTLYFAIGISGAIQHLAGVNRSKVIVVINKDPEAPFFKAADYGVVGDLFEVVPKLTAAIKKAKAAH